MRRRDCLPAPVALFLLLAQTPLAAQTLSAFAPRISRDSIHVRVFADGAVRAAIAGEGGPTSAGSIGVSIASQRNLFSAQISLASANDTLSSDFGVALLTPGSGGTLAAGLIDFRRREVVGAFGLHTYASASSSRWFTQDPAAPRTSIGIAVAGFGLSLYHEVINQPIGDDNSVAVLLDGGLAYRGLFGDIARATNNPVKLRTLGTTTEHFFGFEIGMTIQVNDVRAGLGFLFFDTDAVGLGDGQLVAGFALQGALLSWTGLGN
jgi:hypothetical protein